MLRHWDNFMGRCVWQELASVRNSSWSDFLTQTKPSFLSSLLYRHSIVVSLLSSFTLSLEHTRTHPNTHTRIHAQTYAHFLVMASNGLQAQARTGLTAVGPISRNTWWVPALVSGLIYKAWDCQQLPLQIKTPVHLYCFQEWASCNLLWLFSVV